MPYTRAIDRLAALVRARRGAQTLQEAADAIGTVSAASRSRVEPGSVPDMKTFLALCNWLNVAPAMLFRSPDAAPPGDEVMGETSVSPLLTGLLQILADRFVIGNRCRLS